MNPWIARIAGDTRFDIFYPQAVNAGPITRGARFELVNGTHGRSGEQLDIWSAVSAEDRGQASHLRRRRG